MILHLRPRYVLHATIFLLLQLGFFYSQSQTHTAKHVSMIANSGGFYEYLPQNYNSESGTYPLLVFLHGIGELGDGGVNDLTKILYNGPPRYINDGTFPVTFNVNGESFKFIVISPQFLYWPSTPDVQGVIDYAVRNYRVNTNRIYLTGLSMGGGAVWDFAGANSTNATRLAALLPVCGLSGPIDERISVLTNAALPIWATHNLYDDIVPVANTIGYIDKIAALNLQLNPFSSYILNPIAKKTIFQASGHDAYTVTYNPSFKENNMNVYEWMLHYQRGNQASAPAPVNQSPTAIAGADQAITLPANSVSLSGGGTDPDGSISSYSWSKLSGPSSSNINSANSNYTAITDLVTGTYTFRLTVTDNAGATAFDDVTVTVNSATSSSGGVIALPGKLEAENYSNMFGVNKENTTDEGGGQNIGWIDNGDWMEYNVNVAYSGNFNVNLRVATNYSGQQLQLSTQDGTILTTVNVPVTGGFQSWRTVSTTVSLKAGNQKIRISSVQNGWWNINWADFSAVPASISVGYLPVPGKLEAENYSSMFGVITESTADDGGGSNVGWIVKGNWMDYNVNVAASGNYAVNFRLATPYAGQQLQVLASNGNILATLNIPQTGSFQSWQTVSVPFYLSKGNQTIRIVSVQNGFWNVNWMEFVSGSLNTAADAAGSSLNGAILSDINPSTEKVFTVYPNPVNKSFMFQLKNKYIGQMNVQIVSLAGVVVKQYKLSKDVSVSQLNLSAASIPPGTYFIKVQIGKWSDTKKLIKL